MAPRKLTNGVHISVNTCAAQRQAAIEWADARSLDLAKAIRILLAYALQRAAEGEAIPLCDPARHYDGPVIAA
jgi:hypothetical protein